MGGFEFQYYMVWGSKFGICVIICGYFHSSICNDSIGFIMGLVGLIVFIVFIVFIVGQYGACSGVRSMYWGLGTTLYEQSKLKTNGSLLVLSEGKNVLQRYFMSWKSLSEMAW